MRAAMAAELEGRPIPDGNPNQWADRTRTTSSLIMMRMLRSSDGGRMVGESRSKRLEGTAMVGMIHL
jgi:hypothetical protein